jgi:hypothetical protein
MTITKKAANDAVTAMGKALRAGNKPLGAKEEAEAHEQINGLREPAPPVTPPAPTPPASKIPVFAADFTKKDTSEFSSGQSTYNGNLSYTTGYEGEVGLKAEATGINAYARAQAGPTQTGWKQGDDVRWGGAFYLSPGFFAAKQGQIDIFRWDNWEQNEKNAASPVERGGLVNFGGDKSLRLVHILEGTGGFQETLIEGPELAEGRWYWAEVRQTLDTGATAHNELWIDGVKVGESSVANLSNAATVVDRYRAGLCATSEKQTKPLSVVVSRIRSGPLPLIGP